jgi:DNA polymerase III sliding clamp (beta) subunit (PCNA family)
MKITKKKTRPTKVEREHLVKVLTVAAIGLTKRESIEQSDAYVFTKKYLITFNGEIFTRCPNPLSGVQGAVPAQELHQLLAKFPDPEVTFQVVGGELHIRGKRRKAGISLQKKISLPFDDVPLVVPAKWRGVSEKLSGVLTQAARVCGKDETLPITTVVHVTKKFVESSDNFRIFRYTMPTKFPRSVLIPASSIAALGGLVFERVSINKDYLFLEMPDEHLIAVRCVKMIYPDIGPLLRLKRPKKITLPSNMEDIISRADVMQETAFDASVTVTIEANRLELESRKDKGWYRESKTIDYDGERLKFTVHPRTLEDVLSKKKTVWVDEAASKMKLRVKEAEFVISLEMED